MTTFLDLGPEELDDYWQEDPELNELEIIEKFAEENGLFSCNKDVIDWFNIGLLPFTFNDYMGNLVEHGLLHPVQTRCYTHEGEQIK